MKSSLSFSFFLLINQAEMGKAFVEKDSVAILTAMSNSLMKNSEGKGYFVGDSVSNHEQPRMANNQEWVGLESG